MEEFLAVGEKGGKEGFGSIAECDSCRKEEKKGALPPGHSSVLLLLATCQIKRHRQEKE